MGAGRRAAVNIAFVPSSLSPAWLFWILLLGVGLQGGINLLSESLHLRGVGQTLGICREQWISFLVNASAGHPPPDSITLTTSLSVRIDTWNSCMGTTGKQADHLQQMAVLTNSLSEGF